MTWKIKNVIVIYVLQSIFYFSGLFPDISLIELRGWKTRWFNAENAKIAKNHEI